MLVRLRVCNTTVEQPVIQLIEALYSHSWREEALAYQADLVLDLPLLPARRWRTGRRLHQIMAAHLQKAPVELALLAKEHRLHRRLHIVVDAARAGALEEREGAGMGIEHHLLAFARIDPHKRHPAMAQPHMGGFHHHRDAIHHNGLVAPVELVGFAGREGQRNIGLRRGSPARFPPTLGIAPNSIITAVEPKIAQRLENPHQRQPLPRGLGLVRRQKLIQLLRQAPSFGIG